MKKHLCFYHIDSIKKSLGIQGVYTEISSWRSQISQPNVQIDLILDRKDQIIHLCEIKFSETPFAISKQYASELQHKIGAFKAETMTKKTVFLTLIAPYGLKKNINSGLVRVELTFEALFVE